tara:strand:+ start:576 stop:818 length:243 start_codon:yes stop_codon:yes gene_type:complete
VSATYNVTGNQFTSLDLLLNTITDDSCSHGDITLQTGDDIGSLLFLVPTDNSIKQQNTDNNTKINPLTQTSREQDSDFHY